VSEKREPLTARQWRGIISMYQVLHEMENPDSMRELEAMVADLRRDSAALNQRALRLEIEVDGPDLKLADFGANAIRRRLTAAGYQERHLRLTEGYLDGLADRVTNERGQLRSQAWILDLAAERAIAWFEIYRERRDEIRKHSKGRPRSVSGDFLVEQTLHCKLSEVAQHLVEAKAIPDREADYDDPAEQWAQALKRARSRYRERKGQK